MAKSYCAKCLAQREYICTDCLGCENGECCSCKSITPEWSHIASIRGKQADRQLFKRLSEGKVTVPAGLKVP